MTEPMPAFRLAMRTEGNKWTAYCAQGATMDGAVWMGSISVGVVSNNNERRKAFIELMKSALIDFLEQQGVEVDHWEERGAPESERSGSA